MLFDTDVLIWCFRGNRKAARLIDTTDDCRLSIISYMELLQGGRDTTELREIKRFLLDLGFQVVPLSEAIGQRACVYMEEYALSGNLCLADALISATAVENAMKLVTGNKKHFSLIRELDIKVFRP